MHAADVAVAANVAANVADVAAKFLAALMAFTLPPRVALVVASASEAIVSYVSFVSRVRQSLCK
jgi:hypothetical protein